MSEAVAPSPTVVVDALDLSSTTSDLHRTFVHTPQVATEFHGFLELPPELRLRIYDYMIPGPRIISIKRNPKGDLYTDSQVPLVLCISPESRKYTLEKFSKISFGQQNPNIPFQPDGPGPFGVYINYTLNAVDLSYDTLCHSHYDPSFLEKIGKDACSRIRHILLPTQAVSRGESTRLMLRNVSDLTSLRSVSMVYTRLRKPKEKQSKGKMSKGVNSNGKKANENHNLSLEASKETERISESRCLFYHNQRVRELQLMVRDLRRSGVSDNILRTLQTYLVCVSDDENVDTESLVWTRLELN